jgi:hypothetical protein
LGADKIDRIRRAIVENIQIVKGIKLIGLRDHLGQWWKVDQDCVRCGQCCLDRDPHWVFAADEFLGGCKYLEEETEETYMCGLKTARPFSCTGNSPFSKVDYCKVTFVKVDNVEEIIG